MEMENARNKSNAKISILQFLRLIVRKTIIMVPDRNNMGKYRESLN